MKKLLLLLAGLFSIGLVTSQKWEPEPSEPKPPKPPSDPKAPPWNPPAPGTSLQQSEVTADMQAWAIDVLHGPGEIHSVWGRNFPEGTVLARKEWHTKQASTGKEGLFKGVSLYWA